MSEEAEFEINEKGSFCEATKSESGVMTIISAPTFERVADYIPAFISKGADIYFNNEGEAIPKD